MDPNLRPSDDESETDSEEWKLVHNIWVSSLGRVRHPRTDQPYIPCPSPLYAIVVREGKRHCLGRLVLEAFHGPAPSSKHTADHIDQNRLNNQATNLRWANRSLQNANRKVPKNNASSKSIEVNFGEGWVEYPSRAEACRLLGLNKGGVHTVLIGKHSHHHGAQFRYSKPKEIDHEEWREVHGITVSNAGRVMLNNKAMSPVPGQTGYCRHRGFLVHRLVAQAFLATPLHGEQTVDHINRIKSDNRALNLRWATMKQQSSNQSRPSYSFQHSRSVRVAFSDGTSSCFGSVKSAASAAGISSTHVRAVSKGNRVSAAGTVFEYL